MLVNKRIAKTSQPMHKCLSPRLPWSPPEPSMPSNVATSPTCGRNGTSTLMPTKPGKIGKPIGHTSSRKTATFDVSLAAPSGTRPTQSSTTTSPKMVLSLDNLTNAAIQKNDTIEKFVHTNNQLTAVNLKLTEHVSRLQEQNTTLLHILEKYAGGSLGGIKAFMPTDSSHVWDPAGYCWTHGFKVKRDTKQQNLQNSGRRAPGGHHPADHHGG
eukprot:CCRYP_010898-RA/>CCRYP_010898-RA protein AED:0.43 eAED:0.43 QI:0/-1/0/1/-1/1/1/0/212